MLILFQTYLCIWRLPYHFSPRRRCPKMLRIQTKRNFTVTSLIPRRNIPAWRTFRVEQVCVGLFTVWKGPSTPTNLLNRMRCKFEGFFFPFRTYFYSQCGHTCSLSVSSSLWRYVPSSTCVEKRPKFKSCWKWATCSSIEPLKSTNAIWAYLNQ